MSALSRALAKYPSRSAAARAEERNSTLREVAELLGTLADSCDVRAFVNDDLTAGAEMRAAEEALSKASTIVAGLVKDEREGE